jgi:hypothetical protein
MIQQAFANRAKIIWEANEEVIGLAVGGSWLTKELDEFSDLDLILVTKNIVSGNKELMLNYANQLGNLLTGFTGEHVGEPRLLICLYENPLLHVDIKFVTLAEFGTRIETPFILFDKDGQLEKILQTTTAKFPYPDFKWIEDRFWTWIHYALLKIGRGEYVEAIDFIAYLRMTVLGPLLLMKNKKLPRGVRKVETDLLAADFEKLKLTIPSYNKTEILKSLRLAVELYKQLSMALFTTEIQLNVKTEEAVMMYFEEIEGRG